MRFFLYKFGLWKKLDTVLRKILDLILPKEHTDQSGPEPSTKNGFFFHGK